MVERVKSTLRQRLQNGCQAKAVRVRSALPRKIADIFYNPATKTHLDTYSRRPGVDLSCLTARAMVKPMQ
jgi:hypothetical protein